MASQAMSTSAPPSSCNCPSNGNIDSALSTAANVLSILTFAFVFLSGASYSLTAQWGVGGEKAKLRDRQEKLCDRLLTLLRKFDSHKKIPQIQKGMYQAYLKEPLVKLEGKITELEADVDALSSGSKQWDTMSRHVQIRPWRRRKRDLSLDGGLASKCPDTIDRKLAY